MKPHRLYCVKWREATGERREIGDLSEEEARCLESLVEATGGQKVERVFVRVRRPDETEEVAAPEPWLTRKAS